MGEFRVCPVVKMIFWVSVEREDEERFSSWLYQTQEGHHRH